jgi:CubicO group peptidase (beta-lactamase class C family)
MTNWLRSSSGWAVLATAALVRPAAADQGAPAKLNDGWTVAAPGDVGLDPAVLGRIDSLAAAGGLGILDAFVIVKDGKLVFERYYPSYRTGPPPIAPELDGMTTNRPFPSQPSGPLTAANVPPHTIQSASKGITALVVGAAVDRGLVRLDQPLTELLPRSAALLRSDPRKARLTLRHVLTMTTGLDWNEAALPYQNPENLARRLNASDDWVTFTLSQPMREEPGTRFEYCSGCTLLLSAIVQQATKRHTDEFADEAVFGPMGIGPTVWLRHARSADSLSHTGGGLWLRPRDFAKLGYLHLSGGKWHGKAVVSSEWIRDVGSRHTERSIAGYGYQWIVRDVPGLAGSGPADLVYAWGAAGQFVFAVKPLNLVVAVNGANWEGTELANPAYGMAILTTAVDAARR